MALLDELRPLPKVDSYFARTFLLFSLVNFLALVGLVTIADLFQRADEFVQYAKDEEEAGFFSVMWLIAVTLWFHRSKLQYLMRYKERFTF